MRRPTEPDREANVHIHPGAQWVAGKYHAGWHPIIRNHETVTPEGRELHLQHRREYAEERGEKEVAMAAKVSGRCSVCKAHIRPGEPVWFNPKTRTIRNRDTLCDAVLDEPVGEKGTGKTTDIGTEQLSKHVEALRNAFTEQTADMHRRVNEAEKHAEEAEKRAEQVEKLVNTTRKIEVVIERDGVKPIKGKKIGVQHKHFERLLKYVGAGVNVALVGDAGSGKTRAPRELARALSLPFYHTPVGPTTSKSDLVGFINGAGKYVYSMLRHVYELGGVGCIDEMDAANAGVLTIVNGMLDSIEAGFADKMVQRHKDAIFVACMNTYGRGADMLFVGRAQLDAATLSRWVWLEWNTDWDLTRHIVSGILQKPDEWVQHIRMLYESAAQQKVRVAGLGMRTAILGARLLAAGIEREEVELAAIWQPVKPDDKQKILAGMSREG